MSILRKQSRSNYTHIANDVLEDARLSFRARGIAAYLLSKPDDWVIRIEALAREAREGEKAIISAMKELATFGYLRRDRAHDELGHIYTVTLIADYPVFADQGTPQERRIGYTDPPETAGSVTESTDPPETEGSVNRGSENRGVGFGGVIINTDLPIPDLPIPDTNSDANASAHPAAAPAGPPLSLADSFRDFHDRLKAPGGNRAEILHCAYRHCYGDHDSPDHGRLGAFARAVGGWGQALDRLWSNTARPPNGDILAYLEAQHAVRRRDRAAKPAPMTDVDRAAYAVGEPSGPAATQETPKRPPSDPWAVTLHELRRACGPDDIAPLDDSRLVAADGVDGVPLYRVLLDRPDPNGYLNQRFATLIRRTLSTILHQSVLIEIVSQEEDPP